MIASLLERAVTAQALGVFTMVGVQARDKPDVWSVMENDTVEVACLRSHTPVFFSLVRHRCLTSQTHGPLGCTIFVTMSDEQVVVLVGAFRRVRYYRGGLCRDDQGGAPRRLCSIRVLI